MAYKPDLIFSGKARGLSKRGALRAITGVTYIYWAMLERLVTGKPSSLFGFFVSYEDNSFTAFKPGPQFMSFHDNLQCLSLEGLSNSP
jgi:hypothetical protein